MIIVYAAGRGGNMYVGRYGYLMYAMYVCMICMYIHRYQLIEKYMQVTQVLIKGHYHLLLLLLV